MSPRNTWFLIFLALCLSLALVPACSGSGGYGGAPATAGPSITTQPANVRVNPGQPAAFAVAAAGTAPLTYQWNRNGVAIPGSNGPLYALPAAALGDSGASFTVTVSNTFGSVTSAAATLTVLPPASVAITAPASIVAGASATASIQDAGAVAFNWSDNGLALPAAAANSGVSSVRFTAGTDGAVSLACIITDAGGAQTLATVSVPILPAQPFAITEQNPVEPGPQGYTASVPAVSGDSYVWTVTGTGAGAGASISSGQGSNSITYTVPGPGTSARPAVAAATPPGTVTVQVTQTDPATGFSATASGTVTVLPALTAGMVVISAPTSALAGQQDLPASVQVPLNPDGSYRWTVQWTVSGAGTLTPGISANQPAITFQAGASGTVALAVVVTDPISQNQSTASATCAISGPAPSFTIQAPAFVEAGNAAQASVRPDLAGYTYAWTVTGAAQTQPTPGGDSSQLTFLPGASGAVRLGATVTDGSGHTFQAVGWTSTILNTATPIIVVPSAVPENSQVTARVQSPQPGTLYTWTVTGASSSVTGPLTGASIQFPVATGTPQGGNQPGRVILGVSAADEANQASASQTNLPSASATLQVFAAPAAPVIQAPQDVTANQTGVLLQLQNPDPTLTYAWSLSDPSLTFTGNPTGPSVVFSAGPAETFTVICTATNPANLSATGAATLTVKADPGLQITAPAQVTANTPGHTASVALSGNATLAGNDTFVWSVQGGTLTAGQGTSTITYLAGPGPVLNLSVEAQINGAQDGSNFASATETVVPAPSQPVITVPPTVIAGQGNLQASVPDQGPGFTYSWTFSPAQTLTGGTGSPTVTFTADVPGPVTVQCIASNSLQVPSVPGSASFTIQPPSSGFTITVPDPPVVNPNQSGLTASASGAPSGTASYAWTVTGGTLTRGQGSANITYSSGSEQTVYLQVTAVDGQNATLAFASASVAVANPPTAVITVTPASPTQGNLVTVSVPDQGPGFSYAWSLSDSNLGFTTATHAPIASFIAGPAETLTVSCTVVNPLGAPLSGQQPVTVAALTQLPVTLDPPIATTGQTVTASVPDLGSYGGSLYSYAWSLSSNQPFTPNGDGSSITFTAGPATTVPVTVTCTVSNPSLTATALPGPGQASLTIAPVLVPVITVTAPGNQQPPTSGTTPVLTAGQTYTASVPPQGVASCSWTLVLNGVAQTINSLNPSVTFIPGAAGSLSLEVTANNLASAPFAAPPLGATVVAAMATPSLTVQDLSTLRTVADTASATGNSIVTLGHTYLASVSASDPSLAVSVTASGGGVPPGTGFPSLPFFPSNGTTPVTLTFQAENSATQAIAYGTPVTLQVVPVPVIYDFAATPLQFAPKEPVTLIASFTGGTGLVNLATGATSVVSNTPLQDQPSAGTSYVLTVTNPAGDAVNSGSISVAPVTGSLITSFTASPAAMGPDSGVGALLSAWFGGGGSATLGGGDLTAPFPALDSGASLTTAADLLQGIQVFTLTLPANSTVTSLRSDPLRPAAIGAVGAIATPALVAVGNLTAMAGTPSGLGNPDTLFDGPSPRFAQPGALAVDVNGNTYVADSLNNAIRRIDPSGTVATVAGNLGHGSEDGDRNTARFNNPEGLALQLNADGSGLIYVADTGNSAIRVITIPTGGDLTQTIVSTLALTPALLGQAALNAPQGIALDSEGDLFVADTGNFCISQIPHGSTTVSVLAGTSGTPGTVDGKGTLAAFSHPTDLFCSGLTLFVADQDGAGGGSIRQIDLTSSTVSTVYAAGSPLDQVAGITVSGTQLYWADPDQGAILGNPLQTGTLTTASLLSNGFLDPQGLASHPDGSFELAERGRNQIVTLDANGNATRRAGTAGLAGQEDGQGTAARFDQPRGIAYEAGSQNVFVADSAHGLIRSVTSSGATATVSLGGTTLQDPEGLAALNAPGISSHLYMADAGDSTILDLLITLNPGGNVTSASAVDVLDSTSFSQPRGLAVSAVAAGGTLLAHDLLVADTGHNQISRVRGPMVLAGDSGGAAGFADDSAGAGTAKFNAPSGVAVDAFGNVFVADTNNNAIRMIPAGTQQVSTIAGSGTRPAGHEDGPAATWARFDHPTGVVVDSAGRLVVTDTGNSAIRLVVPGPGSTSAEQWAAATVITIAGSPATSTTPGGQVLAQPGQPGQALNQGNQPLPGTLAFPQGVTVDPSGNVWFTLDDAVMQLQFHP